MSERKSLTNKIKDGIIYILLAIIGIGYAIVQLFYKRKGPNETEEVIRLKRERVELHEQIKEQKEIRKKNEQDYKDNLQDIESNSDPDNVIDFFNKRYGSDDNRNS